MITGAVRGSAAASFGFLLNSFGAITMIWILIFIAVLAGLWLILDRSGLPEYCDTLIAGSGLAGIAVATHLWHSGPAR